MSTLEPTAKDIGPGSGESTEPRTQSSSMRQLWSDNVHFTRRYVIEAVGGPPVSEVLVRALDGAVPPIATAPGIRKLVPQLSTGDEAAIRLLENVEFLGSAIASYFGKEAGTQVTKLLRRHVVIAVKLLAAARGGDIPEFVAKDADWLANADQIAALLNRLNERWPREDLTRRLHLLLQLTKDEAVARVTGDSDGDRRTFDRIYSEAMGIADVLTNGLQELQTTQDRESGGREG
jgi:hypothetical protein